MSIGVSCKLHKRQGGEKMTITMSGKTIGENIKLARMQAGISRAKLAEELCVSEVMVYKYETDSANVHPRKLKKIAEVCGVSVEELTAIGA